MSISKDLLRPRKFCCRKCKRALNLGSEKKLKEFMNFIHSSVNEIIQAKKRKLEKDGANDLLLKFLGAGLDDEMVRDMVISFLMAGRDTTSAALTWLFWRVRAALVCFLKPKTLKQYVGRIDEEIRFHLKNHWYGNNEIKAD
ncbi:Cytochrome [Forsythia ovata]|uniref:Cytochrome n=1 Tax=Forsythia ovata TaxID=205694 RepID=A0ABD1XCT9_9LAMI